MRFHEILLPVDHSNGNVTHSLRCTKADVLLFGLPKRKKEKKAFTIPESPPARSDARDFHRLYVSTGARA